MCKKYRYLAYYEIPAKVITFIENVAGMNVHSLSVPEINNFLNDMDGWYSEQKQDIEDFIYG